MEAYNTLLLRQLKKSNIHLDQTKPDYLALQKLLELVSDTYNTYEEEKQLLERSIEISSKEYIESLEKSKKLQAQLVHNEKMAGIGQLSAGIAHEINNPLGFVQSNMDTLKKYIKKMQNLYLLNQSMIAESEALTCDEYKVRCNALKDYMQTAKIGYVFNDLSDITVETDEGLLRIEKIVKSLLGFARKGYEEEFSEYDMNKGVKNTLTIATNEIKYYAKVVERLEPIPVFKALSGEINQVLLNLIVNAAQAIKSKGVSGTITIHTYFRDGWIYCEIADDGIGIPENKIGRIFEPFYTTKPIGMGTGLGLSIAYDIIVNKHKGKIEVESAVNEGTTFRLILPMVYEDTNEGDDGV